MAAALMKYETIDKSQIDDLMSRRPVRVPEGWDDIPPSHSSHGDAVTDEVKGKEDSKNEKSIGGAAEQN